MCPSIGGGPRLEVAPRPHAGVRGATGIRLASIPGSISAGAHPAPAEDQTPAAGSASWRKLHAGDVRGRYTAIDVRDPA